MLKGLPASPGIVISKALLFKNDELVVVDSKILNSEVQKEIDSFLSAVEAAKHEINEQLDLKVDSLPKEIREIFNAHLMLLDDVELITSVKDKISTELSNSAYAVKAVITTFADTFEGMDNEYMRERAADIRDIGKRLIRNLLGIQAIRIGELNDECILIARDFGPSETAEFKNSKVMGFITEIGGITSHSAIMARTFEIPAIVGTGSQIYTIKNDDLLILDGETGEVHINPDATLLDEYRKKSSKQQEYKLLLDTYRNKPSITLDGHSIEIAANIGTVADVEAVLERNADGIGLFRTEFLFMDRKSMPEEETQFNAYKHVLEAMKGKPVIIRTLDIGGDKKLSYLPISEEMNPFLGYRAIRLCLDNIPLFKTQLRALLRASVYGNLRIMFPMISSLEELRATKSILEEVKTDLDNNSIPYSKDFKVGIMIEIPSAAIISDLLAREVDFFSIGTNDLIQYSIAVDRMNEKVSYLYTPTSPAIIRLIKLVVENGHNAGIEVGMCGEMAGDLKLIPLLVGLGLDEISMSSPATLRARKLVSSLTLENCKKLVIKVLKLSTSTEISAVLDKFSKQ